MEDASVQPRGFCLGLELSLQLKSASAVIRGWLGGRHWREPYRILTVSKPWVTVTAPQAAKPPAMNALFGDRGQEMHSEGLIELTNPSVVDMVLSCYSRCAPSSIARRLELVSRYVYDYQHHKDVANLWRM